jgi:2'-5' RNA ligase
MARIFFALTLPEAVRDRLERLQSRFGLAPGVVKWVEKRNLHLTLQFIGEVSEEKVLKMLGDAASAASMTDRFDLEIRGAGAFPGASRPRVLWAGVGGGENQTRLLAEELARRLGIVPDKPFSPHITLGRVREGCKVQISDALCRERDYCAGTVPVERLVCFESTLTPKGPVYREIAVFYLRQGGRIASPAAACGRAEDIN